MDWKPIKTAPKDGTIILGANKYGAFDCYWEKNGMKTSEDVPGWVDGSTNCYEELYICKPTHWVPMPPLPTED